MAEFTVAGQNYKSGKIPAMQQFHVARRLAPVMSSLAASFKDGEVDMEAIFEPVAKAIGSLSDMDSEYVINACLDVVSINQGTIGLWARVRVNGRLMFEFIGMPEMMQIVFAVLQDNFAPFFSGLPAQVTAPIQA